jgi:hypothetical protein
LGEEQGEDPEARRLNDVVQAVPDQI